ncbi:ABC transporter substrate-binding protein [Allopusillimonas soli]|uniref:ABC transporter substrate-binding protein n=1 Tax=Allopusillimonas soli TaxID=659016 RepID=A0A853F938_9BURK|nr:ABC transporter substrate-binding protein [Allopusillimonas soli]NYT36459.1 ABC transporter substrate-binding protein [Allopusillimonas soli]TEA74966.1 ABC transporter substrate-binding protein [Allopusillimonas soli]
MKLLSIALMLAVATLSGVAYADNESVKIGVLTDMSGPYADVVGEGSVIATQLAAEDCKAKECKGMKIEVIPGDHQNRPDIGLQIARKWIDVDHVDAMVDLTNSAIALGVARMLKDKTHVIGLFSGPGTTKLANDACVPNGFKWMYDTYSLAVAPIKALKQKGIKSIYIITADYAFGHQLEKDAMDTAKEVGIEVKGSVRHPLNNFDFSSFLMGAQASGAEAIVLANAGNDTITALKQAAEFGLTKSHSITALLMMLTDVHAVGLEQAQGLTYVTGYYSDLNEQARSFAKRFEERHGRAPTMTQAGTYSAALHYLRAVAKAGTTDGVKVGPVMREMKVSDDVIQSGYIREDGLLIHDMYLVQVKSPSESKRPWDYEKLIATIPGDDAYSPLEKSTCPLLKQ